MPVCTNIRVLMATALLLTVSAAPAPVRAAFHLWEIREVYSNADGSIQYVELFTTVNNQQFVEGHTIQATSDGVTRTFTFPSDSGSPTANQHLLIATPGFAALPGAVTPDFTLPCGPFFDPGATSITIDFVGADSITFAGADLPTDGSNALHDMNLGGAPDLQSATASPTSFAGSTGSLSLSTCLADGTCDPCDDGTFCNGAESCSAGACSSPGDPCSAGETCVESTDSCVAPDAGPPDAGPPDAGPPDAGPPDAGTETDAGAATDAGADTDAGTAMDAGTATDAGSPVDAGLADDAGTGEDGGVPAEDAGGADAGAADAGAPDRSDGGGCECRATGGGELPDAAWLAAVVLLLLRRRHRRR